MYETYLAESDLELETDVSNREVLEQAEQEVLEEVEEAARQALESAKHSIPNPAEQQLGVFAGVS
jgi:hypothetical protein